MKRILVSLSILAAISSCNQLPKADYILHHGKIYTVDSSFSVAEAVAVKDGKILAVGSNIEIENGFATDSSVDLKGKVVYPGLFDAHCHFYGYGHGLHEVNLWMSKDEAEMVSRVKEFAPKSSETWIIGRGWDQNIFPSKKYPTRKSLDEAFPDRPVFLKRIDGHAALANTKALQLAGVTEATSISGGELLKDNGQLNGILIDNAVDLVERVVPKASSATIARDLLDAQSDCLRQGLTAFADAGLKREVIQVIDSLSKAGKFFMKVNAMLDGADSSTLAWFEQQKPTFAPNLKVTAVKVYADGALGSRGAYLKQPYNDQAGYRGLLLMTESKMDELAQYCHRNQLQMATHCIGDSSLALVLNIYKRYLKPGNDNRWRIEHAQIVAPEDIHTFGEYGVLPSVQPTHATSDMRWAGTRIGDRLKYSYCLKQLRAENGYLPLGSDFPVEQVNPFLGFFAATQRTEIGGWPKGGFQMENALNREEALKGMTIDAAKAQRIEKQAGSIEKGKCADFVIMNEDLMRVSPEKIPQIRILNSVIDGKLVFNSLNKK